MCKFIKKIIVWYLNQSIKNKNGFPSGMLPLNMTTC